jgi:histidine kinase
MLSAQKSGNKKFQDFNFEQAIEEINIYHIELEMQVEELQQNRAALEKNKAYLNYLFAYAPVGYIVLDNQGYISDANITAISYFGYEKELLKEYRLQHFITADTYTNFHKCMRDLEDLEISQHTELRFRRQDNTIFWGRIDLSFHTNIIDDQVILCSILDITDRKKAEKALKEKQAQLTHADRLSSLGEMATGMAHELNQPLSRIRVNAQGIQILFNNQSELAKGLAEKLNKRMTAIIQEVDRAASIIEHMRGFARSKGDQLFINIREPIESSLHFFQEQFKNHCIALETHFDDALPEIFINPQLLEQIIVNLLSNARYAVDKKEENMQSTNDQSKYQKRVTISLFEDSNRFLVLKVSDNGIGMTDHEKRACMEPFFTTKKVGEVTGLGLSIVRNNVKEFSGVLNIESQKDDGTDVTLFIPMNLNTGSNS